MAKDKTVHEFVLSAFDENDNLMLAARGSEVMRNNISRMAMKFVGRFFMLEDRSLGDDTLLRFTARSPVLNNDAAAEVREDLKLLRGWLKGEQWVTDYLTERKIKDHAAAVAHLIERATASLKRIG